MSGCPTPGKMVFESRGAAKAAAKWTERKNYASGHQLRPYRCICGHWHLTTLAGRNKQLDRRRRRRSPRDDAA